ncbi:hypothetical protein NP603_16120 [Methylomonas sp. SURF-1]|uniref:Uncharacterized protein n=1 Tax=Methylomonas aurea TaxID=2952224 RepID=A0ABT1UK89_9GAMM|nr:hypothetical protein [Methylomonas sp. SURF-1]MCQ8182648.1 hypothetical protein [Methylomonas sp. SURF-1]
MPLINKSELNYRYSWTAIPGDNPKVTGEPDSTRFSRNEGYEVLYLINKLAEIWDFKKLASAHKIEKMIKNELPSDIQTQKGVKDWIKANW